jgi:hypothetical protein
MLKEQLWEPDTHPGVQLFTQWNTEEPGAHVCLRAIVGGVEHDDPEGVYLTILAENRLKNTSLKIIEDALPVAYKKPVLDSDGDPTGAMVVKDKHKPQWDFGAVDGKISFTVPDLDDATRAILVPLLPDGVILG